MLFHKIYRASALSSANLLLNIHYQSFMMDDKLTGILPTKYVNVNFYFGHMLSDNFYNENIDEQFRYISNIYNAYVFV